VPCFAGIISAEAPVTTPALLPTGGVYTVVGGPSGAYVAWFNGPYVFGMRLNADGTPNVATRKLLGSDARDSESTGPNVYAVDDSIYVAYVPKGNTTTLRVLRVDGGVDVTLPNATLMWNGSRFLAIDGITVDFSGTLYDRNLNVVVSRFFVRNGTDSFVFLNSAGGKFILGTTPRINSTTDGTAKLNAVIIDNDGKTTVTSLPNYIQYYRPALISNGAEYLFVWQTDPLHLIAQHFSPAGAPASDLFAVAARTQLGIQFPTGAWSGSEYVVSWAITDGWTQTGQSYGHVRGTTASVEADAPSTSLKLMSSPNGAFAVYTNRDFIPLIQRLDVADTPRPFILGGRAQSAVDIASADISTTGVLWRESEHLWFGRLDASGQPLDGNGILLGGPYEPARVIAGPLDFLVIRNAGSIRAQLLSRDGKLVGAEKTIFTPSQYDYVTSFDAVWNGSSFTILWSTTAGIDGAVILPTGDVGGTLPPYALGPVTLAGGSPPLAVFGTGTLRGKFLDSSLSFPIQTGGVLRPIAVATSGKDYLILAARMNTNYSSATTWDVLVTRFDARGNVIDAPLMLMTGAQLSYPNGQPTIVNFGVLWDGNNYRAAWLDGSNQLVVATIDHAQVTTSVVPVPGGLGLNPRIASPGGGRLLVLYDRAVSDPWFGQENRAFVRDIDVPRHHAAGH